MENNLEDSNFSIDLNSNPVQNPNEEIPPEDELIQELSRVKSENKRLIDLLTIVSRKFSEIKQIMQLEEEELSRSTRKRKADDLDNQNISSSNVIRSNISRVYVRIDPSDVSLVVKDGYNWRKYGQKVTRNNPSPRAYYKCSFAPSCPAKKKVQRSVDDPTLLVATYEGQHHHHHHCHSAPPDNSAGLPSDSGGRASSPGRPVSVQHACTTPTSDDCNKTQSAIATSESNEIRQQFFVEKMVSSLTRNSGFTTALAAAITGRILDEVITFD